MVMVVLFEFSVMRCQPLRRALALQSIYGALLRKRIIHFICYFSSGNKPFKALSLGRSLESAKNFILYFGSDSSWIHYYATKPIYGRKL